MLITSSTKSKFNFIRVFFFFFVVAFCNYVIATPVVLHDFFSSSDASHLRDRAFKVASSRQADIIDFDFAIRILSILENGSNDSKLLCSIAKEIINNQNSIESFRALNAAETLNCGDIKTVAPALDTSSLQSLYHSSLARLHLSEQVDSTLVFSTLKTLLGSDNLFRNTVKDEKGSSSNNALAAELLATFAPTTTKSADLTSCLEALKAIVSINSKDNGLDCYDPSLVYYLQTATQTPLHFKQKELTQILEDLLQLVDSNSLPVIYRAILSLNTLNILPDPPVVITLSQHVLSLDSTKKDSTNPSSAEILVTNLFGLAIVDASITVKSIEHQNGQVITKDHGLTNSVLGAKEFFPFPGKYQVSLSVKLPNLSKPLTTELPVYVTSPLSIQSVNIIISPTKKSTDGKRYPINQQNSLHDVSASGISNENIFVTFSVQQTGKNFVPDYALLRFTNAKSGKDTLFTATVEESLMVVQLSLFDKMDQFGKVSGDYIVSILVGDRSSSSAIEMILGEIELEFPPIVHKDYPIYSRPLLYDTDNTLQILPEKFHTFRTPERRPSPAVSTLFSALVLLPLLFFIFGLIYIGAFNFGNLAGASSGFFGLLFYICLAAILGLYVWYWVDLTMVVTLKMLIPLGIVTFLVGQKTLSSLKI